MWKGRFESINKMTSGVFYSVLIHSLIITAYVLLVFRIFYINEFHLDLLNHVFGFCFFYLLFIIAEVVLRQCYGEEYPVPVTKAAHFCHLFGTIFLTPFMVPANPVENILFSLLTLSLLWWTSFVLIAAFDAALIAEYQERERRERSLTQLLV